MDTLTLPWVCCLPTVWVQASSFRYLSLSFLVCPTGGCEDLIEIIHGNNPWKAHTAGPQYIICMEESTRCVKRDTNLGKFDKKNMKVAWKEIFTVHVIFCILCIL